MNLSLTGGSSWSHRANICMAGGERNAVSLPAMFFLCKASESHCSRLLRPFFQFDERHRQQGEDSDDKPLYGGERRRFEDELERRE